MNLRCVQQPAVKTPAAGLPKSKSTSSIFLRPRKISKISIEKSHAISRAAACRRSAQLLWTSKGKIKKGRNQAAHPQAACILVRSHAISRNEKFCGRENFSKFSVENRTQSHAPQHADARHSCWGPLKVVRRLRVTRRHGFRRVSARFRTRNFAAAKKLRKFRFEIR